MRNGWGVPRVAIALPIMAIRRSCAPAVNRACRSLSPLAGLLAVVLVAGACSVSRGGLPRWVETPPKDDAYLYAVGVRTGAPTIEEARRGAIEQAVGELARRFGVQSRTSYEEVRTEIETRVRDEIESRTGAVEIKDATLRESVVRQTPGGWDAYVLLRYPREQAERERARLQSHEAAVLHAASRARRRGDEARARGDAAGAITAYLEAAASADDSTAGTMLRTEALQRLSAVAEALRVEPLAGEDQAARLLAPLERPLEVQVLLGDAPAGGFPLRAEVSEGGARLSPERVVTDSTGRATVTVSRVTSLPGDLTLEVRPDLDRLRSAIAMMPPTVDAALQRVATRAAVFRLPADRTRRALRVAVIVDERGGGGRRRRSFMAAMLADKLNQSGFRVVADHELGKTNIGLLRQVVDRNRFQSVDPLLTGLVDVVVGGWCETRPGSDNRGWAISALADAEVKAVEVATGEVLAAYSVFGRAGFGEEKERARMDALRAVAEEVAEELTVQLAGETERRPTAPLTAGESER